MFLIGTATAFPANLPSRSSWPSSAPIFTRAGNWSASRSSPPAARASAHRAEIFPSFKRMSPTSPANSATTSTPPTMSSCRMWTWEKIRSHRGRISKARRCRISCASWAASECTRATCRVIPLPMDAFACRNSWRKTSSSLSLPARPLASVTKTAPGGIPRLSACASSFPAT